MSLLAKNSLAAERQRGLVFVEKFKSLEEIARNGGKGFGQNPPIDEDGATFTQPNERFMYTGLPQLTEFTVLLDLRINSFINNVYQTFMSDRTVAGTHFEIGLNDVGSTEKKLYYYTGSIFLSTRTIKLGKHKIAVVFKNNQVSFYVDGAKFGDTITADAPGTRRDNLVVGTVYNSGQISMATFKEIKIFNVALTEQEIIDYQNNGTFNYDTKAVVNLPMFAAQHDATNKRALDVSGRANNATFGDGTNSSTFPSRLTRRGYNLDGNDYFNIPVNLGAYSKLSYAISIYPSFGTRDGNELYLFSTTDAKYSLARLSNANSYALGVKMGGTAFNISEGAYSPYWLQNQTNTLVICGDADNDVNRAWFNGVKVLEDTTAWTQSSATELKIGQNGSNDKFYIGNIHSFSVYPFCLTETQAIDIHLRNMRQVNMEW